MGQQRMDMKDGSTIWKYLCDRYEGTANDPTKAMTKRQLYAQLESAKCKQNGKVEAHLNYMCRRKGRLKTVGMTVDDTYSAECWWRRSPLMSGLTVCEGLWTPEWTVWTHRKRWCPWR